MRLMSSSTSLPPEILSLAQTAAADRAAVDAGRPVQALMESAGRAIAEVVAARFPQGQIAVLAGPGNNGGDGFVAARFLALRGRNVRLALLGNPEKLKGEAAHAAARWDGPIESLTREIIGGAQVVVDGIFGAGLSRSLPDVVIDTLNAVRERDLPVVAIDLPSGVNGDTGTAVEGVLPADATVTFHRLKPAHVLFPGRGLCGELVLADIGISDDAVATQTFLNGPVVWQEQVVRPDWRSHKYERGALVVVGGPIRRSGAARLAACAALRSGAGVVTMAVPSEAVKGYIGNPRALMIEPVSELQEMRTLFEDGRIRAAVVGPGNGVGARTRSLVELAAAARLSVVLDADALTSFEHNAESFASFCRHAEAAVLTPHDGEFHRIFPDLRGDRLCRARAAAARTGAIVVSKGPDTVVAHPDGRTVINANAPETLATAGSGDVLAGIIGGLLATKMDPFSAAAAGVWLHGAAAQAHGSGLIADDLLTCLPEALRAAGF